MAFDIEDDVPVPYTGNTSGRPSRYPWAQLQVGQSFVIPPNKKSNKGPARGGLAASAKKYNIKITTAEEEGGLRVWRIS
jgi:hypothetical protein